MISLSSRPASKAVLMALRCLPLLLFMAFPVAAQTAGSVGAVNRDATGAPPSKKPRDLSVGQAIVQNERIRTNANGTVHLIFNDRSALNIGRNANVVIDQFVYDPAAGAGDMTLTLAKGAARFVGGQISHTRGANLKTPVAAIGIRGGNISLVHDDPEAPGQTTVFVHHGIATISNALGTTTVRAGFQITVSNNAPPANPTPINRAALKNVTLRLASQGTQTGGADQRPEDSDASRNQIGTPRLPMDTPDLDLDGLGDELNRGRAIQEYNERG
jgi:hypothetical protein